MVPQNSESAGPEWAVTMFSFTTELVTGDRTPLQLIEDVAEQDLARIVEIDGPQHFSTFPSFDREEIEQVRDLVDRHGLRLSMLGIYNDSAARIDRAFSLEESERFVAQQIEGAARLGFWAVRIAFPTDPALLERLVPHARNHGIRILEEVQGAATVDSAVFAEHRELVARLGSDTLGFVFDLSACMAALPVTYLEELRRLGVPEKAVRYLDDSWVSEHPATVRAELDRLVDGALLTSAARVRLSMPFGRFGHSTVADWRDVLGEFSAIHLKYWDLEDDDYRVSRPLADVRREFGAIGYDGIVTSEWGGHEWFELDQANGFDMTRGHHRLFDESLTRVYSGS
jgi:sugar phosphate isomerase/epimerase